MKKKKISDLFAYKHQFERIHKELQALKLPAAMLVIAIFGAYTLPYAGRGLAKVCSLWHLESPKQSCTFVNLASINEQEKIQTFVTERSQALTMISGTRTLARELLQAFPSIRAVECSLDKAQTIHLVITGDVSNQNTEPMNQLPTIQPIVLEQPAPPPALNLHATRTTSRKSNIFNFDFGTTLTTPLSCAPTPVLNPAHAYFDKLLKREHSYAHFSFKHHLPTQVTVHHQTKSRSKLLGEEL